MGLARVTQQVSGIVGVRTEDYEKPETQRGKDEFRGGSHLGKELNV